MASVISVLAKISANTTSFVGGMKQATAAAENFNKVAVQGTKQAEQQANANMGKFSQGAIKVGTLVKGALLGVLAIQGKQFLQGAIQQASNFEAEFEGVNQTFGAGSKIVQDFAANASKTAGLAETTALRFAKSFGGYAKSAGLAGEAQATFSTNMVQAAGDLGSFFDLPTESALMAIQQGLRGEYEPLRRFNILIDEAAIGQKAMAEGVSKTGKNLTQQQKILMREKLIMEQLGVAQGDFVKYADTYGNSVKTVGALMQNLQKDVGAALLPALAKLAQAFMPIVEKLAPMLQAVIEKLAPVIDTVAGAMDRLLPALEPIMDAFGILMDVVVDVLDVALDPLIQLVNMLAPVIKDIASLIQAIAKPLLVILKPLLDLLLMALVPVLWIVTGVIKLLAWLFEQWGKALEWVYNNVIKPIWDALSEAFTVIAKEIEDALGIDMQHLFEDLGRAFERMWKDFMKPAMDAIVKGVKWLAERIKILAPKIAAALRAAFGPIILVIDYLERQGIYERRGRNTKDRMASGGKARGSKSKVGDTYTTGDDVPDPDDDDDDGGKPDKPKTPILDFYRNLREEVEKQKARVVLAAKGLNADLIEQVVGMGEGWQKVYNFIKVGGTKTIKSIESLFAQTAAGFGKIADAVKSSMAQIHESIMNGFNLTGFGKSAKQVLTNARRMVERAKAFGDEIVKLAGMNLNPVLLNQIIAAGPMEGMALAKSLSSAGMPTINELNSLYNQAGDIATGTAKGFAGTQSNYYIEVSGGLGDKATIGKAIVEAVKGYERSNGKVFSS
jgi:phage-related protein